MAQTVIPLQQRGFGETMRRDAWWTQPLLTFVVLGGFVVYATWAAFQGNHYEYGPYLSPVLLAAAVRRRSAQLVRPRAGVVAGGAAVLGGAADPVGAGRLPLHLLLLPRRLLQGVLGGSAVLRRRRAAQVVPRRAIVPADPAERPPLLPLPRARVPVRPGVRRLEGAVVHRSGHRRSGRSASASARSCWP